MGSMWVPYGCGEKNVMSFRKTNMLGQFGIATTDVCCETWVRMRETLYSHLFHQTASGILEGSSLKRSSQEL